MVSQMTPQCCRLQAGFQGLLWLPLLRLPLLQVCLMPVIEQLFCHVAYTVTPRAQQGRAGQGSEQGR